jgi:hypothetical protein
VSRVFDESTTYPSVVCVLLRAALTIPLSSFINRAIFRKRMLDEIFLQLIRAMYQDTYCSLFYYRSYKKVQIFTPSVVAAGLSYPEYN